MSLDVTLPLQTVSENRSMRAHRMANVRRAQAQRTGVFTGIRPALRRAALTEALPTGTGAKGPGGCTLDWRPVGPLVVTMTRLSRGELDDDNLRGALKAVRDGIADALGLASDRDPRVRWEYGQGRGSARMPFGVRIEVRRREIEVERPRGGLDG